MNARDRETAGRPARRAERRGSPCAGLRNAGATLAVCVLAASSPVALVPAARAGVLEPALARALARHESARDAHPATDLGLAGNANGPGARLLADRDGSRWRVQLLLARDAVRGEALEESLAALGASAHGEPWRASSRVREVWCPPEALERLGALDGVAHVARPVGPWIEPPLEPAASSPPLPGARGSTGAVESEALADMAVPAFHALGYRGGGIRVGVVDVGFEGFASRVGGELPPHVRFRDFTGVGPSGQSHGTACAEVLADVAPEIELYLAQIATSVDLQEAIEWFRDERVEVVSHSLAWFLGGGDGTGPIVELTRDAAGEGIHWVTSAGNFRRSYWEGAVVDADGDGFLETDDEGSEDVGMTPASSGSIGLVLAWNRWPLSEDVSFQIDVYDGETRVATSETEFGGDYPYAFRQIEVDGAARLADPRFRVRADRGGGAGLRVRVFRLDGGSLSAEDRREAGSVAVPADSPWALAVGAHSYRATSLEPFSSYGPTGAGLQKPELAAADGISTSLSNYARFVGTSAACPHAAGAVALLLSADLEGGVFRLHWSREEIALFLARSADPFPAVPPDEQGWGRLRLPVTSLPRPGGTLAVVAQAPGAVVFRLLPSHRREAAPLVIYDVTGRRVAVLSPRGAGPDSRRHAARTDAEHAGGPGALEYTLDDTVAELRAGRYWARDPASGASVPFFWIRR